MREASFLMEKALEIRRDVVNMIGLARSGHLPASLSIADILAWLYWSVLDVEPADPWRETRDRLVFSEGNGTPALYATLANRGFFERDELWSYRRLGGLLQGYPQVFRTPGVDAPGGAAGIGLGIANGIALALRQRSVTSTVFCLAGEGDAREGVFWEALMTASLCELENVVLILAMSEEGITEFFGRPKPPFPHSAGPFSAWAIEACDAHDVSSLEAALELLSNEKRPKCLVARTVRGKGVSFIEDGSFGERVLFDRQCIDEALVELEKGREKL